jgi:3'-phosphoadenosine 5'-phosphosulfate sulfotransferase (PAPS reductase)/FAD synthetase
MKKMTVQNSKERSAKIKEHIDYYNSIKEIGVIDACKNGIIKKVGVSVSGGKDSVATLLWAKNNLPPNIEIIGSYAKTPLENKDIEKYIKYISEETGIRIDIYSHTDQENKKQIELLLKSASEIGPPFTIRNCEMTMKEPIYKKFNIKTDIQLIGVRWMESQSRQKVSKLYRLNYRIYYHPIIAWSKIDVFNYIKENNIKLYYGYKFSDRLGCSLCPLSLGKKNCSQIYFILKMRDRVDFDFYSAWYEILNNYKFDRSCSSFVNRLNYLKSNWRKLKKILENPHDLNIKIKEFNPPNCGWFE